jgi:hypothetical protein
MIIEDHEEVFIEATESSGLKVAAAVAALLVTVLVFFGYAYLRRRQLQSAAPTQPVNVQPKPSPQALVLVDEALIQGSNTVLGGTVRNISNQKLSAVSVELELKRRTGVGVEKKQVPLNPAELGPLEEGRYSLQLKAQDYLSARVVGLYSGSQATIPFTLAQGDKRPPERLESKTIKIDKSAPGKRSEFLNSPDNPARVP